MKATRTSPKKMKTKAKAVDLVTGKAQVEYFFDPTLVLKDECGPPKASHNSLREAVEPWANCPSSDDSSKNDAILYQSRHLFMPCTIVKLLGEEERVPSSVGQVPAPALVKTSDGALHKISDSRNLLPLTSPEDYIGINDVLHLPHATEASLLHALRLRYKRGEIYTSAGPILVSVNPYKNLTVGGQSLYSEKMMMQYRQNGAASTHADKLDDLPPHLFELADRAYSALTSPSTTHMEEEDALLSMETNHETGHGVRNQSIIISGESGAGKTQATKIIMQYLACIATGRLPANPISDETFAATLEQRVLSTNPLLEAFGNAQTLRNDNSSRFGKYIQISFNTGSGSMVGATITNYLLEKTRLTAQVEGERNFHIFYQLLAGSEESLLDELGLAGGTSAFRYLGNRKGSKSRQDVAAFSEMKLCLDNIGISDQEQKKVLRVVAAVLHLGNVDFEEKGDDDEADHSGESENARVTESSKESLAMASKLLGLQTTAVEDAMLTKLLIVGGKTIHKPQNVAQAVDKRDALAKLTYSSLFEWLVKRINKIISASSPEAPSGDSSANGSIGVLDIYGFETFDTNGFETLLINYANERLQRHFNRHLFEVEQNLYASEGVDWTYIKFNDNRPCLELIEGGGGGKVGILNTLDDAWDGMGMVSEKNDKFVSHLHHLFGGQQPRASVIKRNGGGGVRHPNFITPKFGNDRQFIVLHYAGEVRYTANDFVEKNVETLSNELKELGLESSEELSRELYACTSSNAAQSTNGSPRRSAIRGVSVSSQFRTSLQALVVDLERTQPNYIRCIKPNLNKSPDSFDSGEILRQLRYAGMMETIRIRREGYTLREDHESFYNRFSILLTSKDLSSGAGITHMVEVLSKRLGVTDADWQIGHSKIFLRRELASKLEALSSIRIHAAARTLGRFGRGVAERRASMLLTHWARFRLRILRRKRENKAATKVGATYRRYKQRQSFKKSRIAVIKIQSIQRRKQAFVVTRRLRDPYGHLSFNELKEIYDKEQSLLDEAVKSKDFQRAADIEGSMESLRNALEEKRPMTRALLEERIGEVQQTLEEALRRKSYAECEGLQDKLDELIAKRSSIRTTKELHAALREAETDTKEAIGRRDFAAAAKSQISIDELKKQLEESLAAESNTDEKQDITAAGYESRVELESEITSVAKKIEAAIVSKDFSTAAALQERLEQMETLREMLPTVADLEAKISSAKKDIDDAVAANDFNRAGVLQNEVDTLQKMLTAEKQRAEAEPVTIDDKDQTGVSVFMPSGVAKHFESREQLENEISRMSASLSEAVESKSFLKAQELQSTIDELKSKRELLPTLEELKKSVRETNALKKEAISAKNFTLADKLQETVDVLEEKLTRMRGKNRSVPEEVSITTSRPESADKDTLGKLGGTPKALPRNVRMKIDSDNSRPVHRLRPRKPVIARPQESVLSVAQTITKARGDAALIVLDEQGFAGVLTPHHVTENVVAKHLDPADTSVSTVMKTKRGVYLTDSAGEALSNMLENRHRYLPVMDDNGGLVGILDIGQCLNDAILKLEQTQESTSSSAAQDIVKQMATLQVGPGTHVKALQALLNPVLEQAFGKKQSPTLRKLLSGKPSTIISPNTNVREASIVMANDDKAALVVENGALVGMVTVKNVMERAVAKQLPLELTAASSIMTPHPVHVSPDVTALEALQIMQEDRVLSLPVCEDNGTVIGSVDVMDVIYGCGGAEGWRSVFDSSMLLGDDCSTLSVVSHGKSSTMVPTTESRNNAAPLNKEPRPVHKLRPRKIRVISKPQESVLSVAKTVTKARGDAAIIMLDEKGYAGVLTPHHVTEKIVAKNLDPASTPVSKVMKTKRGVYLTDSAGEALSNMLENRHRYLPVMDASGGLVGILDIGQCLNDAISLLKQAHETRSRVARDVVKQMATLQAGQGTHVEALQALLSPVLEQAFGEKESPTLRKLLSGKPSTIVSPTTNLREASMVMSKTDKAALVVEKGELLGMVTVKDIMERAVAAELSPDQTSVTTIMELHPEHISPDITAVEALQIMHEDKVSSLPVCESDGTVLGSVDVLDLIYGCGGAQGWRSVFDRSMDIVEDASECSSTQNAVTSKNPVGHFSAVGNTKSSRLVSRLRSKIPDVVDSQESVLSVAQTLVKAQGDAALVVQPERGFAGVLTPYHVTERVLAEYLDPATTSVSSVMERKKCVSMSDCAVDALCNMLDNRHRYLPVMQDSGEICGLLDIGQCLNDAISRLERAHKSSSRRASPPLRQLLAEKPAAVVSPNTNVREAGIVMAEKQQAALVVEGGVLIGMVSVKDVMERAIAKEVSPELTLVTKIMTPNPEVISPETTALEALEIMHDDGLLSLPVCEEDGTVLGSVDAIDLIYGSCGNQGWRSMFDSSMDVADDYKNMPTLPTEAQSPTKTAGRTQPFTVRTDVLSTPTSVPTLVEIPDSSSRSTSTGSQVIQFKVVYPNDSIRRVRCKPTLTKLLEALGDVELTFIDDEGDSVAITSDECLSDAISHAHLLGNQIVKLRAANPTPTKRSWWDSVASVSTSVASVKKPW